ncbi:hypothetical protein HYZ97_02770 [Candidatus Pacearchaeota archaeon]|nr:hypothetical protein [Candidatus Pacearchaeota archaeon]
MPLTQDPTVASWTPINMWAMLRALINNNTPILTNNGAPINGIGGTFSGQAGPGALLIDFLNANLYINQGTLVSPIWDKLISSPSGVLFNEGVQAAGTTQSNATVTTGFFIRVTGGTGGIRLPLAVPGTSIVVINHSGASIQVYGSGVDTIDDVATTTGVAQMNNSTVFYVTTKAGTYYSEGLASGFSPSTGLQTLSSSSSIEANFIQTQARATQLTSMLNRISVCAHQGDGVALPAAFPGEVVLVENRGANAIQVYGNFAAQDTINGNTSSVGIAQGVNTVTSYICFVQGNWEVSNVPLADSIFQLSVDGAIPPHVPITYVITKPSPLYATLAAPTTTVDDGIKVAFVSNTAFVHVISAIGLLQTGSSAINYITLNTLGSSLELIAFQGKWIVKNQNGVSFQ